MKTNPGGQLAVNEILGRDSLCDDIREALVGQSVIMTAERRIGKTSVMKILEEKPEENWVPIYLDLEKVMDANSFAKTIYNEVQKYLSTSQRAINLGKELYQKLGGVEANGFKLPETKEQTWQEVLEASISVLSTEQKETGKQVLFLWDEVPYMLSNILDADGEKAAMAVLDLLRSLRREFDNFRILITGSIGLHHVLKELNKNGYRNEPINDMYTIEVNPLEAQYSVTLATELIKGEGIDTEDIESVAQAIAEHTDHFPFYIHHVVRTLKSRKEKVTVASVEEVILEKLIDDNDPWELKHYDDRIKDYYEDDASLVKIILDVLAIQEKDGFTPKQLLDEIKKQTKFDDIERLRQLLRQLNLDHYLSKDVKGQYSFRFPLIQKWWITSREL